MKKTIFFMLSFVCISFMFAQNIFPSSGNVGIGTTTPTENLEVVGNIKADKGYIKTILEFGTGLAGDAKIKTQLTSSGSYSNYIFDGSSPGFREIVNIFPPSSSNPIGYYWHALRDGSGDYFYQMIHFQGQSSMSFPSPQTKLLLGMLGPNSPHNFVVNNGTSFFNDNVGIGTESFIDVADNNQEYKLSVNGHIRAEAVKVYTDWADFVFEDDYNLPTLIEVEQHIKKHGHLKDIPSAKEVDAKGIELGEMNKLLLQKIEELTLYTIKQQKQLNKMQIEIAKIKTQN